MCIYLTTSELRTPHYSGHCSNGVPNTHTHTHVYSCIIIDVMLLLLIQVKEVMSDNINKVVERGDKLDDLGERAGKVYKVKDKHSN